MWRRALLLGSVVCVWSLGHAGCGIPSSPAPKVDPVSVHDDSLEQCGLPMSTQPLPEPKVPRGFGVLKQANACGPGSKQEPDPRSFTGAPEAYARYDGQTQCSPTAKTGMKAFRDLILKTYPCTGDYGISRACSSGGKSEHKEGRAWDWKLNAPHPAADAVIKWLLATRNGVAHAYARRVGLMYMIWNRKIWKAYQPTKGWQAYTGASPHTDHVHFSFSRKGGDGNMSFWGGKIAEPKKLDAKFEGQGTSAMGPANGQQHSLCPGQSFSFFFKVKNTGNINWTDVNKSEPGRAVRLGFRKGTAFGAPTRVSVNTTSNKDVKPGQSVTFTMKGKAPTKAGSYRTEWQVVSELVSWFGPSMWLSFSVTAKPPGHGKSCQVQGQGANCGQGVMKCTPQGLSCVSTSGTAETCNGKDDDCNGKTDDGLSRSCYSGPAETQDRGRCRSGTQSCTEGTWGACTGEIKPAQEICGNTIDDDCDGQTDEGCGTNGCEDKDGDGYGVGQQCTGDLDCNDEDKSVYPGAPEICDNGKDDDCRGGDRPCQSTLPEDSGGIFPPQDAGPSSTPDRLQLCQQPPCDVTTLTPEPKAPPKAGCSGCSQGSSSRGDLWWLLGLLGLFALSIRTRRPWS